jgi:putative transposase
MTHVRTLPFYPPSNCKIERWHKSLKEECLRPGVPSSVEEARRMVAGYVDYYHRVRLHSASRYAAPLDRLEGQAEAIWTERDRKPEEARWQRQLRRQEASRDPWLQPRAMMGAAPAAGLN